MLSEFKNKNEMWVTYEKQKNKQTTYERMKN